MKQVALQSLRLRRRERELLNMSGRGSELRQLLQLHNIEREQLAQQALYAHNGNLEAQVQAQQITEVLGTRGNDLQQILIAADM